MRTPSAVAHASKSLLAAASRALGVGQRRSSGPSAALLSIDVAIHGVALDSDGLFRKLSLPADGAGDSAGRCSPAVACLGRSQYLLKVVEIPAVEPAEVKAVLALELEAMLPAEFGELELSHRQLACEKAGYQRYEVYIASREALADYLEKFHVAGVRVDSLLPTAAAWRNLLEAHREVDVLMAPAGPGRLEMAALAGDGSIVVRGLSGHSGAAPEGGEVAAFLMPLLDMIQKSPADARVGWLASEDQPPPIATASRIEASPPAGPEPLLEELARSGREPRTAALNLMPSDQVARTQWRGVLKGLAGAAALVMLGIALLYSAIAVSTARLRWASADLESSVARIKGEGEKVGRGIDQLTAIDAARATQNDFHKVLEGLLDATPPGVTYSQVDFRSGELELHGSASSLSLVFTLPEALEKQSMFQKVLLKDAGQAKSSGGVTAEFDIQCILARRSSK